MKHVLLFVLIIGFSQTALAADDGIAECSTAVKKTLAGKHGISTLESCEMKSFGDTKSSLVHITFGESQDCAAGCIPNHLCSIVASEDEPANATSDIFLFSFNNTADNILARQLDKEEQAYLIKNEVIYSDYPGQPTKTLKIIEKLTPGKKHPLVQTPAFLSFIKEQKTNNGPFRWCSYE